jgi:hypothetical protein
MVWGYFNNLEQGQTERDRARVIGIGGAVTRSPLPHYRTGGSAYGGSVS